MRTRLVQVGDATALMNILNPEVIELEVSFDLVPKTLEEQREWIREHQGTHICLVAVNTEDDLGELGAQGERILGFASVSPFRERAAYATTVENSIYVHRGARSRGVGEVLLNDLIAAAERQDFTRSSRESSAKTRDPFASTKSAASPSWAPRSRSDASTCAGWTSSSIST